MIETSVRHHLRIEIINEPLKLNHIMVFSHLFTYIAEKHRHNSLKLKA